MEFFPALIRISVVLAVGFVPTAWAREDCSLCGPEASGDSAAAVRSLVRDSSGILKDPCPKRVWRGDKGYRRVEAAYERHAQRLQSELPVETGLGVPIFIRIIKYDGDMEAAPDWFKRPGDWFTPKGHPSENRNPFNLMGGDKPPGTLEMWILDSEERKYRLFKSYPIQAMSGLPGPKRNVNDLQAAEGFYNVCADRMNPQSAYHLSFDVGYPNLFDRRRREGAGAGSLIMVHGKNASDGCFAMGDDAVEEIYVLAEAALNRNRAADGKQYCFPVHIFPFRMTDANLNAISVEEKKRLSKALKGNAGVELDVDGFWRQLQDGYQKFEETKLPPSIGVTGRADEARYISGPSAPLPKTAACTPR